MASQINTKEIIRKISTSRKFKNKVSSVIGKLKNDANKQILSKFDNHPITKEISAGPKSANTSGTLGGYGNLFSYIGFTKGTYPTSQLRSVIGNTLRLTLWKQSIRKQNLEIMYRMKLPTMDQVYAASPMPWEGGSWVKGVEEGMSNFGFYMYKKFSGGRSGMGLQADHELRKAIFTPKQYVSEILNNFKHIVKNRNWQK